MSGFYAASLQFASPAADWLSDFRANAAKQWQAFSYPTRSTEAWKYTSLKTLDSRESFTVPQAIDVSQDDLPVIEGDRIVFVNGQFADALSTISLQSGLTVVPFSQADDTQQSQILTKLGTLSDASEHGFTALNGQCLQEGLFVNVEKNVQAAQVLHVIHYADNANSALVSNRLLVNVESGANVSVVEHYVTADSEQQTVNNNVAELVVGDNASLRYYQLLEVETGTVQIGGVHALMGRDAKLDSFNLALGSQLSRVDYTVTYTGAGGYASVNGIYLPHGKQHVDYHTCIEHAVPHCNTDEVFRGIVADKSTAVFNGRIHIHRDAQKTEAYLSNKNLLTSDSAKINTKPELEIYADDVKCAHGATVAALDPLSVHYLRTRGVSEADAMTMLSFGFINELLDGLSLASVADYCRPLLAARFSKDHTLLAHS